MGDPATGNPGGQAPGQSGGEQGGKGESAPSVFDVTVNGEKKQVGVAELISGYQQNDSYTQKSQKLAEKERGLDQWIEDKATELYLEALKNGNKEGSNGEGGSGGSSSEGEESSDSEKLSAKISELEKRLSDSEQSELNKGTDAELEGIVSGLKDKYKNADMDKVQIRFHNEAKDHEDVNEVFERIAKEENDNSEKNRQAIIDAYIKAKTEHPFASGETGHSVGTGDGNKPPTPLKTFDEARERAEKRFDALRGR